MRGVVLGGLCVVGDTKVVVTALVVTIGVEAAMVVARGTLGVEGGFRASQPHTRQPQMSV